MKNQRTASVQWLHLKTWTSAFEWFLCVIRFGVTRSAVIDAQGVNIWTGDKYSFQSSRILNNNRRLLKAVQVTGFMGVMLHAVMALWRSIQRGWHGRSGSPMNQRPSCDSEGRRVDGFHQQAEALSGKILWVKIFSLVAESRETVSRSGDVARRKPKSDWFWEN